MAYAIQVTISSANRVALGDQSQEVGVSLTYQLEREDTDLLQVVVEKSLEVAKAHRKALGVLRDEKVREAEGENFIQQYSNGSQTEGVSSETPAPLETITPGQLAALRRLLEQLGWSEQKCKRHLHEQFECQRLEELNATQASQWLLEMQRSVRAQAEQQRQPISRNGISKNAITP